MKTKFSKPCDISILKGTKNSDFKFQNTISKKVAKIFSNQKEKKVINKCIICNSKKINNIAKILKIEFVQCEKCTHVFNKHIYSKKFLKNFWKKDGDIIAVHTHGVQQKYRSKNLSKPKIDEVLKFIKKRKLNWLDMGCGNGEFLKAVRRKGITVHGFDLNKRDIYLARKKGLKNVYETDLAGFYNNISNKKKKFDVISATGYFDMIDNPLQEMKILNKITKRGTIIMIDLPDFDSITHEFIRLFPNESIRHLNACQRSSFTYKSISYLLKKFNYSNLLRWYYGLDFYMIMNILNNHSNKFDKTKTSRIMTKRYSDFQKIFDEEKVSDTIFLVAKKKR